MQRISAIAVSLAVMLFTVSGLLFALTPRSETLTPPATAATTPGPEMTSLMMPELNLQTPVVPPMDLHSLFLRPQSPTLWLLLVAVWIALASHAIGILRRQQLAERAMAAAMPAVMAMPLAAPVAGAPGIDLPDNGRPGPPKAQDIVRRHQLDNAPSEHAPLGLALILGAIWPWIIQDYQAIGFLMALAMLSLALASAIRGQRDGGRIRRLQSVGIFAGWTTAVTYATFATLLHDNLGIPAVAATVAAMLMCAGAGVLVQLRMGGAFSYSVAIIWSLVGLALATMSSNATIAMVAIIGISAMAIVLVRAAS